MSSNRTPQLGTQDFGTALQMDLTRGLALSVVHANDI